MSLLAKTDITQLTVFAIPVIHLALLVSEQLTPAPHVQQVPFCMELLVSLYAQSDITQITEFAIPVIHLALLVSEQLTPAPHVQ